MAKVQDILRLAGMKPKAIVKTGLETYKMIGDSLTYEEITSVFKQYRPLDNGNTKLAKGILSFSLLPVVTCGQQCNGCYDVRSLRYPSVRLKRVVNTILASSRHQERLFSEILDQVQRSRTVTAVRIHVGGDFFSQEYATRWTTIAGLIKHIKPAVRVYTYTKTVYEAYLRHNGINVVKSLLDDGTFNFGPIDEIKAKCKANNGILCPATLRTVEDKFCGSKCKACQERTNVFFVIH